MIETNTATVQDVYNFWNNSFLYSMELDNNEIDKVFFEKINDLKCNDIEKFSYNFWQFDKHKGEKVLDIGCGPGWLVRHYAENGAIVDAIDITDKAVAITNKMLEIYNLSASIQVGNAEELPYEDNTFDFISSSGVLHHTPDMQKAINEAYRVLKPGKEAVISVYYKNILLIDSIFPIFLKVYNVLKPKVPGRDGMLSAKNANDFIRMYDGENNPVGYGVTLQEAKGIFSKFDILEHQIHFFPKRFIPVFKSIPDSLYKILDREFGTMIFLRLRKNK